MKIKNDILLPRIAVLSASAALLLGCLSVPTCDFASLPASLLSSSGSVILETELGLGLWRRQSYELRDGGLYIDNSCSKYEIEGADTAWRASLIFGILALAMGGLDLMFSYWLVCRRRSADDDDDNSDGDESGKGVGTTQARIAGGIFLVAASCQGMTLFFLRSSVCTGGGEGGFRERLGSELAPAEIAYGGGCRLSIGASLGVASAACWLLAGVLFLCVRKSQRGDNASRPSEEEVAVEEEAHDAADVTNNYNVDEEEAIDDAMEKPVGSGDTDTVCDEEEREGEPDASGEQQEEIREVVVEVGEVTSSGVDRPGDSNDGKTGSRSKKEVQIQRKQAKSSKQTRRRRYRS